MQLTLADALSGKVLRQQPVWAARAYPVAQSEAATDPWELLNAQDKIGRLRDLLDRQLARELYKLLAAA